MKQKPEPIWKTLLIVGSIFVVFAGTITGCVFAIVDSDREEHLKSTARDQAIERSIPGCTIRNLGRYKRIESFVVVECPGKNVKTMNQWEWMGKYSKETVTVVIDP